MTDVRLTALNPVDSQVYPVACNTSGELLVADGGGGEYLPLTGGDLTGDLTLGTDKITLNASDGSITAEGTFTVNNNGKFYRPTSKGGDVPGNALLTLVSDVNGIDSNAVSITTDGSITAGGGLNVAGGTSGTGDAPGIEAYKNTSEIGKPPLFVNQANNSGYLITGRNGFTGVNTFTVGVDGNAAFGTPDVTQTDRFGIDLNITVNGGDVVTQCTQNASNFTWLYRAYRGSSYVFYVLANGNAAFTGTVTATVVPPSDARFKENITPAKPQLPDVVALGGILKNYNWNTEAPVNDEIRAQRQLGLIAQEAAEICPSLVKELGSEENRYKGIPMEALIMKLIGAVSELKAELDQLKIT